MKPTTVWSLIKPYLTIKNIIFLFIVIYSVSPFVSQITSRFATTYAYMLMVVAMVALVFGTCRLNNIHRLVFLITPFVLFELLETFTTDEKNILLTIGGTITCSGNTMVLKSRLCGGRIRNPGAARTLATTATSQDPIAVYYNYQNIGGYTFVYSAVLLYPALIIAFKRRRFHLAVSLIGTIMLLMVSAKSAYALSLTLLIMTTTLYFIKRDLSRDGFIKLAFGLLIAIAFFSSVIVALLTYIGNMTGNEEMTEKMVAIFSGKDALEGLEDKRSTLYWFSFRLFLRNPVFGTMPTGYHITGGHSFILDSLAHYGLVGAAILFFMYRAIYNEFYRPFSDKAGYGFVIYSFLMPLGLSVVNTGMWQQNLCVFMPMFLMAIYGKEFAPESAIPKYPRASAAKLRKKEG